MNENLTTSIVDLSSFGEGYIVVPLFSTQISKNRIRVGSIEREANIRIGAEFANVLKMTYIGKPVIISEWLHTDQEKIIKNSGRDAYEKMLQDSKIGDIVYAFYNENGYKFKGNVVDDKAIGFYCAVVKLTTVMYEDILQNGTSFGITETVFDKPKEYNQVPNVEELLYGEPTHLAIVKKPVFNDTTGGIVASIKEGDNQNYLLQNDMLEKIHNTMNVLLDLVKGSKLEKQNDENKPAEGSDAASPAEGDVKATNFDADKFIEALKPLFEIVSDLATRVEKLEADNVKVAEEEKKEDDANENQKQTDNESSGGIVASVRATNKFAENAPKPFNACYTEDVPSGHDSFIDYASSKARQA